MAVNRWTGGQSTVAQVVTITVTADDAATTYKVTINGKVVSVAGSGTGVNATAALLAAALAASTAPEFLEVAWTAAGAIITGTAVAAGVPFTATSSVTGGTGTIGAVTTVTANKSPNDANDPFNWSLAAVPVSTDDVVFEANAVDCLWNLGSLSAVVPNTYRQESSYTGKIGLPQHNPAGYNEYRPTSLAFTGTTAGVTIGTPGAQQFGTGSSRTNLDFGSGNTHGITVYGSGTSEVPGLEAVLLKGTSASNTLEVYGGSVGVAVLAGETANLSGGITVGGNGQLRLGSGVTWAAATVYKGSLATNSGGGTFTIIDGTATHSAGNITTMNLEGGATYYQGVGTIATLNVWAATFDVSLDGSGRTVTNANLYDGATIKDPGKTIAWTNPIVRKGPIARLNMDFGPTGTLLPA